MQETPEDEFRIGQAAGKLHELKGYYGEAAVSRKEFDLIFYGAEQMHISYMQTYGPYAVDSLWKILNYGMEQKEVLWNMINADR